MCISLYLFAIEMGNEGEMMHGKKQMNFMFHVLKNRTLRGF